jgi:hypothetical protein
VRIFAAVSLLTLASVLHAQDAATYAERVMAEEKRMASEDVGVFGMSADLKRHEIPVAYFRLGAMDPVKFTAASNRCPSPPSKPELRR